MVTRRRFLLTAAATAPTLALHAQEKAAEPALPQPTPTCEEPPLPTPILALTDRRKEIFPITVDERNSRLDLSRELMKQYSLDAILMTTGASLQYYTGIRWDLGNRLFAYVIPQSAAPFLICPHFERERLNGIYPALPESESTITYFYEENDDPYRILRRALAEYSITAGTLGIEEQTPFGFAADIARACPTLKTVSATPVTAGCRTLKSPAELALLRLANAITFDVCKAVYLSCNPGDTSHHFTSLIAKAYERCGVEGEASCQVGPGSALLHGTSQPQTIRESEMVQIVSSCSVEGYASDLSRSFVYGKPADLQRVVFQTVLNAQSAALAASGPGVEMQAVDAAARKVIAADYGPGYNHFIQRAGHGIGLDKREWPYLVAGNTQKLVTTMLFTLQPSLYLPGKFGVRLGDSMLIVNEGAKLLTTQSPSLQDPFAIPTVLPEKTASPTNVPAGASPAEPKPIDLKPADQPQNPTQPAAKS